MNSVVEFNKFAADNGAPPWDQNENLILQKELGKEVIFWGSVYGCEFVEMPDKAFTSEAAYRTWCLKTTGRMPNKRGTNEFERYLQPRILAAAVREAAAGTEFGVELEETIENLLKFHKNAIRHLDDGDNWDESVWAWTETIDEKRGPEFIIRLRQLMIALHKTEFFGNIEIKIARRRVVERLLHYGRQVAGRDASVNRLRCAYALPVEVLEGGFAALDTSKTQKGVKSDTQGR